MSSFFLHHCQQMLFLVFLMTAIVTGVTTHCGFDLHFPDDKWCGPSFHYRKSPTHKPSSCELFQRCDCAFHQCQVWMKLQLAFHHLLLTILQLSHASPPFLHQSVTLHAFSLNASPYMPVVVLPYFSRYCTIRFKMYPLFFVCFLMYYLCEKYYKPITVQYYTTDCVSRDT